MKNAFRSCLVLAWLLSLAGCSLHLPWEYMDDYDGVYVVMRVNPDDADVRLNGRYIGAAYEFSSQQQALRLASRQNRLEFSREGYQPRIVDLRDFGSRQIRLNLSLEPTAAAAASAQPPADDPAYEAKSEPMPTLPAEPAARAERHALTLVALTVTTDETAVFIDGRFWGLSTADKKTIFLRLPPGQYALTAFKPGYAPYTRTIAVPKQEKFEIEIALRK